MGNVSIHAVTMVDQTREWFMGSNLDSQSNSEIAVARATIIGRIWVRKWYWLIPCSCPLKMNKYNKCHSMYVLYSKAVVHLLTGHALHGRSDKIEDKDGYTRSRDKSSSLHTSHHKVSLGISSMVMEKYHGNISYRDSRWHHLSTRCLHGPRQWKNLPIYSRFHRGKTRITKKTPDVHLLCGVMSKMFWNIRRVLCVRMGHFVLLI